MPPLKLVCLLSIISFFPFATATDLCVGEAWNSKAQYCMDDKVYLQGKQYTGKWCTINLDPSQNHEKYDGWIENGPCVLEIPCQGTLWNNETQYCQGDKVYLNDVQYTGKWCNIDMNPSTNHEEDDPWTKESPCVPPTTAKPDRLETYSQSNSSIMAAYFVEWGIYERQYFVKNIVDSGSAENLTHLLYGFANITDTGECAIFDEWAALHFPFTANISVDGKPSNGLFSQILKLKGMYPNLKVLYSVGGWKISPRFTKVMENPEKFVQSCYDLMYGTPEYATLFDGIDIDWEYPNACGLSCDASGQDAFKTLMQAVRKKFGDKLVTSAISGDGTKDGVMDCARYDKAADVVDHFHVMSYDYFGPFPPYEQGPTAPMAPQTTFDGIPKEGSNIEKAIEKLTVEYNVSAEKLVLGIPFYGRGWTGVNQSAPGGDATGPANGTYQPGVEDYKVLITECPANETSGGTSYGHCGSDWWSYDTVATTRSKMQYAKSNGMAGVFAWELSGDTKDGELISAMTAGWAEASASSTKTVECSSFHNVCKDGTPEYKKTIHRPRPGRAICNNR